MTSSSSLWSSSLSSSSSSHQDRKTHEVVILAIGIESRLEGAERGYAENVSSYTRTRELPNTSRGGSSCLRVQSGGVEMEVENCYCMAKIDAF